MNVICCLGQHYIAPKEIILLLLLIVTPLASCSEVLIIDYIMVFKIIVIFKIPRWQMMIISQVAYSSHPGRSQLPSDEACGASNITRCIALPSPYFFFYQIGVCISILIML